jgi:Dihaem cytochrome c
MTAGYGPGTYRGHGPEQNGAPPELNSPAGRLFARTCSQCHALPDPRQHPAEQWPSVVARMQQHMEERNIALPGRQALDEIDTFLEQHTNK